MILFSTKDYEYLVRDIRKLSNRVRVGNVWRDTFPDGEKHLRILPYEAKNQTCVIIGATKSNDDLLEIFSLASTLVKHGAQRLIILIPYYGYATMERESIPGEVVSAKVRASLLSAIPRAPYGNVIAMVELHTEVITEYFSDDIRTTNLDTRDVIINALNNFTAENGTVVASTDVGRAKTIERIVRGSVGLEPAFVYKRRESGDTTEVTGINADVEGKVVVVYDDMIRSGGSFAKAVKVYLDYGAARVYGITTHGIFCDNALDKLYASGLKGLAVLDTLPFVYARADEWPNFIKVYSIAPTLTEFLLHE